MKFIKIYDDTKSLYDNHIMIFHKISVLKYDLHPGSPRLLPRY